MMAVHEVTVPLSAASRNLRIASSFLALGLVLMVCHVPWWVFTVFFALSGGFLLSMLMCIMDVQEFKMRQLQEIMNILSRKDRTKNKQKSKLK